jgi:hypothetical protein
MGLLDPPDWKLRKNSTLLFWNFFRADGRRGFSMFAKLPKGAPKGVEVRLATRGNELSFYNWTALRLKAVENAIEPPAFLGSGRSFISNIHQY